MTGATAAVHRFSAADASTANAVAEALNAIGFEMVAVYPIRHTADAEQPTSWRILAFDHGPYDENEPGAYATSILGQHASTIAHKHGARSAGALRCHPSEFRDLVYDPLGEIRVFTGVAAGQRLPQVDIVVRRTPPRLIGLDDVNWGQLTHAYGSAEDIPDLLRQLREDPRDWHNLLSELVFSKLVHQGTYHSASAPTLAFVARLADPRSLPPDRRRRIYQYLQWCAAEWPTRAAESDFIGDPRRLGHDRRWAEAVHTTIAAELHRIFANWDREPPTNRLVLAMLAGTFPEYRDSLALPIAELTRSFAGTRHETYLHLAAALLRRDSAETLEFLSQAARWINIPRKSIHGRVLYVLCCAVSLETNDVQYERPH